MAVLEEKRDAVGAVGGDADVAFAGLSLAFREVSRQSFFGVPAFAVQIGLQLEHGAAEQGVDAAMHFGHRLLEVDVAAVGAEPINQQAMQQGADLFVAGAGGQFRNQFGPFFGCQHAEFLYGDQAPVAAKVAGFRQAPE